MPVYRRVLIATVFGLLAGGVGYYLLVNHGRAANDFSWPLFGARDLLQGLNPYETAISDEHPFRAPLYYPLPALLLAIPVTWLLPAVAGATFMGLSSALLAYAIIRQRAWHLLPIFLSAPFIVALRVGQWGPLMLAVALLPLSWRFLLICKPNLGLVLFAYNPSRRVAVGAVLFGLASLLIMPEWPFWWLASTSLSVGTHTPAVLTLPGIFLLAAVLFWRKPEGRLLLAMALVPQHAYWYDALPLWLIPQTWRQSLLLSLTSIIGFTATSLLIPGIGTTTSTQAVLPWLLTSVHLPALAILLWRYRREIILSQSPADCPLPPAS